MCRTRTPFSQQPLVRECGPLPASTGSPATLASPLMIVRSFRNGSRGRRMGVISNAAPVVGGGYGQAQAATL